MKYLDEYRTPQMVEKMIASMRRKISGDWRIMEICGGQTHALIKHGIDRLLPPQIHLLHGPGCPVCITPAEIIDSAIALSLRPEVIFCTFGDMIRVPGNQGSLLDARSQGADIKIVYSPLDAIALARQNPDKEIIFFAIGFETTAPLNAAAVRTAAQTGIKNFSILNGMVRVPPAIEALLNDPESGIDAFLAPGHVCTISGYRDYELLSEKYRIPFVITGFEPVDLVQGINLAVELLEQSQYPVVNQYSRAASRQGNLHARKMIDETFDVVDRAWRGLGVIARSGYALKAEYRDYDAVCKFNPSINKDKIATKCLAAKILRGQTRPDLCPLFAGECTPEHPLGPMMVSSEGACSAYFHYRR